MLSYGRVVGKLSRITSHAHIKRFPKSLKSVDFINIGCLRYSSKSKKYVTGTTATVEECIPQSKLSDKPPRLPPMPPASTLQGSTPPVAYPENSKPSHQSQSLCKDKTYSCPPNCPPSYQEDCFKPGGFKSGGPTNKDSYFKYWKALLASLLTGVSTYTFLNWSLGDEKIKDIKLTVCKKKKQEPNPKMSNDIPKQVPYLLVGAGTAAFSAFRSIKANDPTAKVLMITNEKDFPYMKPPLSKEIWYNKDETLISKLIFKQWNGIKRSLFFEPPEFYINVSELENSEKGGVAIATGWKVKKIDATKKIAYLQNNYEIKYDKCLIATGASPKNLPVFESISKEIKKKIIPFRTKEDYIQLICNVKKSDVKNIVIIGGGFLGSELSTSLARNLSSEDKKIYQVFKEKYVLAQVLPEYLSKWATEHLKANGVKCVPNVEIHDYRMKNGKLSLMLTDGEVLEADQVIVAIGVKANTDLAKESCLEIDPEQGGFLVNAELEARSNLWVAGDAACFYDIKLGRRRIEHHDNAVRTGKLAGENMVGAHKPYLHQSMFWSDLGQEIGFEAIGIIDSNLETIGVFAKPTEPDTPLAGTDPSNENISTNTELIINKDEIKPKIKSVSQSNTNKISKSIETDPKEKNFEVKSNDYLDNQDDYAKGVIFYLRNKIVVGIVLWNLFNHISVARQLLARETKSDELNEAVKLFSIHED